MGRSNVTVGIAVSREPKAGIRASKIVNLNILTQFRRVADAGGVCYGRDARYGNCKGYIVANGSFSAIDIGRSEGGKEDVSSILSESAGAQDCENDGVRVHLCKSSGC